jgi:ribosomal protein S15P/S13E
LGDHVSDFVFREPCNDYLLVEIEAPHRELFRKDGHPRQALNHAMGQIDDWLAYIQENKAKVERELGLFGIAATPRMLVVIGRSASLTEKNRRTLSVLQSQRQKLTIMTYEDLLDRARANLERHFGPLSIRAQNLDIYFYRHASR